jgi:CheY-like chemotaxis protein
MEKFYKVLIVEDSPEIREIYVERFRQQAGFLIDTAVDGLDGLKKIQLNQYDLIFSGIQMPNKTGFELFQELQAIPEKKDIPFVIFSHLGREEDVEMAKKLGIKYFIIRGQNSPNDILNKILDILHTNDGWYNLIIKKDSPDYYEFMKLFFYDDYSKFENVDDIAMKVKPVDNMEAGKFEISFVNIYQEKDKF